MKGKRIAYLGMLTALAFIFSYVENLIPISIGIPGIKLGLANLVIVVALYTIGFKDALCLSIVRMILVAFSFSNLSAFLYSLAGGVLSLISMAIGKKSGCFSPTGVSVLGGIAHNIGQILMAMAMSRMTTMAGLKSRGSGFRILETELLPSSKPTRIIIMETTMPEYTQCGHDRKDAPRPQALRLA